MTSHFPNSPTERLSCDEHPQGTTARLWASLSRLPPPSHHQRGRSVKLKRLRVSTRVRPCWLHNTREQRCRSSMPGIWHVSRMVVHYRCLCTHPTLLAQP